jgi:hypothetical protein
MNFTPYFELNQVLEELVSSLEDCLGNHLIGLYLQGSFALGDFDEHSDADFIVLLENELSTQEVDSLQTIHSEIYHLGPEWAKHLEGSYFPMDIFQDFYRRDEQLWYLDNGAISLIRSDHCNTLLVRWIVRESGVILKGPSPKELINEIPTDMLRREMYRVLTSWGQQILDNPASWSNRFYQGFIVLNYARMLHDLKRGYPGTKREGSEWAKRNLDPAWTPLIDNAWTTRPDPAKKVKEPADPEEYRRTLKFLEYVLKESEHFMANNN